MRPHKNISALRAAVVMLLTIMLGLALRTKPLAISNWTSAEASAKRKTAVPATVILAQGSSETTTKLAAETTSEAQVASLTTPSPAARPYIRMQINPDGTLEGIFVSQCEPVKQARALQPETGYYYRLVSPKTGETLLDGIVAKPVIRHPHLGVDHGLTYTDCSVTVLDKPVFFDIPNVAARLEIYAATPSSPLAAKYLPLLKAVNLVPM